MTVSSGPGTERLVRTGILAGMFLFMGLWFAYDGLAGYANKNFDEFVATQFDPEVRDEAAKATVYPAVTTDKVADVSKAIEGKSRDEQLGYLEKTFGGPPSFENGTTMYYFGPALLLEFETKRNRFALAEAIPGNQSETSILWQKAFGAIITAMGLGIVCFIIYAAKSHAEVNENGLSIRHRKPIPFDDMRALRHDHFTKKGWIDIDYEQDGSEKTVRLDEYHYDKDKFGAIVAFICQKTGFHDPVQAEKDAKRANNAPDISNTSA